ncbi:MAG: HAMP domain-containing protein [Candidatus Saccharibacteria bacterium]
MKTIKSRLILVIAVMFTINILFGFYIMNNIGITNDIIKTQPTKEITVIQNLLYLSDLSNIIRYEDVVLTQSAKNYTYTGKVEWKDQYNKGVTILDTSIKNAIEKSDSKDKVIFNNIKDANISLIAMESQSIQLVDKGDRLGAQTILDSPEYLKQKQIYKSGLDQFYTNKHISVNTATTESFANLSLINNSIVNSNTGNGILVGILVTIVIIFSTILYLYIYLFVLKPILYLNKVTNNITAGNLNQTILIKSTDEIGTFAHSIEKMMVRIKDSSENVEIKIESRTKELNKLNSLMTGRELKMIELKKTIAELEKNKGKSSTSKSLEDA